MKMAALRAAISFYNTEASPNELDLWGWRWLLVENYPIFSEENSRPEDRRLPPLLAPLFIKLVEVAEGRNARRGSTVLADSVAAAAVRVREASHANTRVRHEPSVHKNQHRRAATEHGAHEESNRLSISGRYRISDDTPLPLPGSYPEAEKIFASSTNGSTVSRPSLSGDELNGTASRTARRSRSAGMEPPAPNDQQEQQRQAFWMARKEALENRRKAEGGLYGKDNVSLYV
eukprot:TRINITY_DN96714_c0_g1_i1.p1 TRINITY_DN96714_c0_g1~~TRINITY_DN96714_c0_g1_i1.p1  ORF type:complete len:272 (+),score=40.40 TRINITY_DN96714_c0_g1_i1:122-817(+)